MTPMKRFQFLEIEEHVQTVPAKHPPVRKAATRPLPQLKKLSVVEIIGKRGSGVGEFNCPGGLALDQDGSLYVADSYNHRLQKITPDGHVITIGSRGSDPGHFLNPQDIVIDDRSRVYIIEQGNSRIQKISLDGRLEMVLGHRGQNRGQFNSPMGLALDPAGCIFVADTGNGRLQKIGPTGKPLWAISSNKDRQLYGPQGVEADSRGNCYIADTFCHCIVKVDSNGREIQRIGCKGGTKMHFDQPQDLALSEDGLLYIVEMANNRLQVIREDGAFVSSFFGGGGIGRLRAPTGIVVSPKGEVFIADTMNHRILKARWRAG